MRQISAQIYDFPAPRRVSVARPRAPFEKLANNYECKLHESRQQIRLAFLSALSCIAIAIMCAICGYAFYISIFSHFMWLWSFATAMAIVGGFFLHLGWVEYREYHGLLSVYRGAVRCGRVQT